MRQFKSFRTIRFNRYYCNNLLSEEGQNSHTKINKLQDEIKALGEKVEKGEKVDKFNAQDLTNIKEELKKIENHLDWFKSCYKSFDNESNKTFNYTIEVSMLTVLVAGFCFIFSCWVK